MSSPTLDYASPPEFDVARFVARYLKIAAWVALATMLATIAIRQELAINASFALFSGTEGMKIDLIVSLENPPLWQALAVCVAVFVAAAVPVALLLSRRGREQFAKPVYTADPSDVAALKQLAGETSRPRVDRAF